jgi:hypothetical protein
MISTTYPYHVVLVPKKKDNERRINYPGWIKTPDSSRGHKIFTRDGSVIDSDLTYKFWNMGRSSHGVFEKPNRNELPFRPSRANRFTPAPSELPTPQDRQPHPLVPSLAASTFIWRALVTVPGVKFLNFKLGPNQTYSRATLNIPDNIDLADPHFNECDKIDLLIGAEFFWRIIGFSQTIDILNKQIYLRRTLLGWVVIVKS